jgi:signal peptidase I
MGFDLALEGGKSTFYHFPLTEEMLQKLQSDTRVLKIVVEPDSEGFTYPVEAHLGWSRDNYGPILIPKKGLTIKLSPNNLLLYKRCIEAYERHSVAIDSNGAIMIDGEAKDTYTFAMDYYFMMGDNRHNSADSRYWGFVPEDHVVGKPVLLWLSLDKDKGLFSGKIRWHRMFRKVTKW